MLTQKKIWLAVIETTPDLNGQEYRDFVWVDFVRVVSRRLRRTLGRGRFSARTWGKSSFALRPLAAEQVLRQRDPWLRIRWRTVSDTELCSPGLFHMLSLLGRW